MKNFLIGLVFLFSCQEYLPEDENDSTWMDMVEPHLTEEDLPDCLRCSELKRPEDYNRACTAAKQIVNALAQCQCNTSNSCPNNCGWLDYLEPTCAESIDWYSCDHFWTICDKDKP